MKANNDMRTIIRLWLPLIVAAFLILIAVTMPFGDTIKFQPSIGFLGIQIDMPNGVFARIVFGFAGLLWMTYPAVRDYSGFFPRRLKITVYFDEAGIYKALAAFSKSELTDANVKSTDWEDNRRQLLSDWNHEFETKGRTDFRLNERSVGVGETIFVTQKISYKNQSYKITEASGFLVFQQENGNHKLEVRSEFDLFPSSNDIIRGSMVEVYLPNRWTKVIKPIFNQWVRTGVQSRYLAGRLLAMTKVRFFPLISISDTIYLREFTSQSGDGDSYVHFVPISYATYNFD